METNNTWTLNNDHSRTYSTGLNMSLYVENSKRERSL